MTKKQTNELIIIHNLEPAKIFTNQGSDSILREIEEAVKNFQPDISSKEGRDEIKSFAYKIARSKTTLDDMGKDLASDWKKKVSAVDEERRKIRLRLDELKEEVRQPLTDFENKEKARIEEKKDRISKMEDFKYIKIDSSKMANDLMIDLSAIYNGGDKFSWEEFEYKAKTIYEQINDYLANVREELVKREKEQAELEKLRKEKIEAEKKAIGQAKIDAENKAREEKRLWEEKRKQAEINAKIEKEEAIRKERARIEAEKREEEEAAKKREEDIKYRTKINNEVLDKLLGYLNNNLDNTSKAKAIIAAIAKGKVPHVSITY